MVPPSIDRRGALPRERMSEAQRDQWWHPRNIRFAANAEGRALALWIGFFVASSVLIALGYVWVRLRVVEVGYRRSVLKQLVGRLEQEGKELTLEAARADTPGRLEREVQYRLGLQRPERSQFAVLP